jgi:hypothetical protein
MKKLLLAFSFCVAFIPAITAQWVQILGIEPNDMVYSKTTDRLYVVLEQTTQFDSLELAVIDPVNAVVEQIIRYPGRPSSLAISNDGNHLFVGSQLPARVRRINLGTGIEELNFALQDDATPIQILPSPNDYNQVVMVEVGPPSFAIKTAVYDGTVPRAQQVLNSEYVAFRNNTTLLGINNAPGNAIIIYDITSNGITQAAIGSIDNYPANTRMRMVGSRLMMSNGKIYSFNGQYPQYFSNYFNEPFEPGSTFVADADSSTVYFIHNWHNPDFKISLHSYQNAGAAKSIIGIDGLSGFAQHLTNTGGHGRLAFEFNPLLGGSKLVLLNPCVSSIAAPVITPSAFGGCDADTITLSGPPGAAGYFWSNGSNDPVILAMFQNTYRLRIYGPDGCLSPPSAPIQILMDAQPPFCNFTNDNPERICAGDSVTLTAIPPSGWGPIIDHFIWSTGATTPSITISTAGTYTVSAVTNNDCIGQTNSIAVEVYPLPDQPLISADTMVDRLVAAPFAFGYNWYLDSLIILDAVSPFLYHPEVGTYTVQIISNQGCLSPLSEPFYWGGVVSTSTPTAPDEAVRYRLIDLQGRVLGLGTAGERWSYGYQDLPAGLYLIQWEDKNGKALHRVGWIKS